MGDYNLDYLNTEEKESLDTVLTPHNLDVVNKLTQTHSKTLIDYIITDLNSTELMSKVFKFHSTNYNRSFSYNFDI